MTSQSKTKMEWHGKFDKKNFPHDRSEKKENGMAQKSPPSCALSKMHRRITFWSSTAASLTKW